MYPAPGTWYTLGNGILVSPGKTWWRWREGFSRQKGQCGQRRGQIGVQPTWTAPRSPAWLLLGGVAWAMPSRAGGLAV